jgi:hypothetical protein
MAYKIERYSVTVGSNSLSLPKSANIIGVQDDAGTKYIIVLYDDTLVGTDSRTIVYGDGTNVTTSNGSIHLAGNLRQIYEPWLAPGTPGAHAATHQHGGGDEVATVTPTANAIPKAKADGTLDSGWLGGGGGGLTQAQILARGLGA